MRHATVAASSPNALAEGASRSRSAAHKIHGIQATDQERFGKLPVDTIGPLTAKTMAPNLALVGETLKPPTNGMHAARTASAGPIHQSERRVRKRERSCTPMSQLSRTARDHRVKAGRRRQPGRVTLLDMARRRSSNDLFKIFPDLPGVRHRTAQEQTDVVHRQVAASRQRAGENILRQKAATERVLAAIARRRPI
jgi:hypothetical protein